MAIETPTTLAGAIATNAIDPLVLDYARQNTFLPRLVWTEDIEGKNTLTWQFPQFGALAASSTTPGTDISATELDVNSAGTITVGEVAVLLELTKIGAIATGGRVNLDVIGRQGGLAVADKLETDIGATFASFSASKGTSGVAMTLQNFDDALYTLRAANAPLGNPSNNNAPLQMYSLVLSEKQLSYMLTAIRQANYLWMGPENTGILNDAGAIPAQVRGRYMGVNIFGSNDLATANSGVDAVGAMFSGAAIGLVTIGGPKSMSIPRPRGRSDEITIYQWYGTGIVVNSYGVKIVNKAT